MTLLFGIHPFYLVHPFPLFGWGLGGPLSWRYLVSLTVSAKCLKGSVRTWWNHHVFILSLCLSPVRFPPSLLSFLSSFPSFLRHSFTTQFKMWSSYFCLPGAGNLDVYQHCQFLPDFRSMSFNFLMFGSILPAMLFLNVWFNCGQITYSDFNPLFVLTCFDSSKCSLLADLSHALGNQYLPLLLGAALLKVT